MGLSRIDDQEAMQIITDTNMYITQYNRKPHAQRGIWTIIDTDPAKLRAVNLQVEKNKLAKLQYKKTGECTCYVCIGSKN